MAGSMVCGIILDKTHAYKYVQHTKNIIPAFLKIMRFFRLTTLVVYGCSFVGMIIYTITLRGGYLSLVYVTAALLG